MRHPLQVACDTSRREPTQKGAENARKMSQRLWRELPAIVLRANE